MRRILHWSFGLSRPASQVLGRVMAGLSPRARGRMRRIIAFALLGSIAAPAVVVAAPRPRAAAAKKARPRQTPVSAKHKKALAERLGGFKFGMTKDEVIAVFSKQLDASYEGRIQETTDIAVQDRLRRDKKNEVNRLRSSYVSFDTAKPSPWDVSIIEGEFAHHTGEAMLERWENQGGKNERRFFFFFEGKLWKIFASLDVSILPEDKKTFATFQAVMETQYGPGEVQDGKITWRTRELEARAIDKLKSYGALALVIEDPRVRPRVDAARAAHAPPPREISGVLKAVIDNDQNDDVDVRANGNAVEEVLRAQGAAPQKAK